jgi:hypothetical protein
MIIEKLGITPGSYVSTIVPCNYNSMTATTKAVFIESEKMHRLKEFASEMLEALIKDSMISYYNDMDNPMFKGSPRIKNKNIIEKATGKTWEEIKELLKEDSYLF